MYKYFLAIPCVGSGILLCAFNKSAFTALGILIGLAAAAGGAYLLWRCFYQRDFPAIPALAAATLGAVLLIVCAAFRRVSLILGGIIFIAAGIVSFVFFCRQSVKLFLPFCIGCIVLGLMIIFLPLWIGLLSIVAGIFLIFYGAVFAFYL